MKTMKTMTDTTRTLTILDCSDARLLAVLNAEDGAQIDCGDVDGVDITLEASSVPGLPLIVAVDAQGDCAPSETRTLEIASRKCGVKLEWADDLGWTPGDGADSRGTVISRAVILAD